MTPFESVNSDPVEGSKIATPTSESHSTGIFRTGAPSWSVTVTLNPEVCETPIVVRVTSTRIDPVVFCAALKAPEVSAESTSVEPPQPNRKRTDSAKIESNTM